MTEENKQTPPLSDRHAWDLEMIALTSVIVKAAAMARKNGLSRDGVALAIAIVCLAVCREGALNEENVWREAQRCCPKDLNLFMGIPS